MSDAPEKTPLGDSISEIIDRTTKIVHEEIELAKAEMSVALQDLLRGSVAGIVGGVFAFFGLFILLIAFSFLVADAVGAWYPWLGFFIVAFICFIVGGLLAFVALKKIKKGSQLAPTQAIDEAKQTRSALQAEPAEAIESTAVEEATPAATPQQPAAADPEVVEAKAEVKEARAEADELELDAKEAKKRAKQEAKEAKEAEKAAKKAEAEAAKAAAVTGKKAERAEKAAAKQRAKAEKQAAKNAKKVETAGGAAAAQPQAEQPPQQMAQPYTPPQPPQTPPPPPHDPTGSN